MPSETALAAYSFFGGRCLAEYFASINWPFFTLSNRSQHDDASPDTKQ